jgi:hypothetical protein
MRLKTAAIAVAAAFAVFAATAADAQPRKKSGKRSVGVGSTVFVSRDERGRTRTRILVQKRSYLDGGTEVMPGELSATNYIQLPSHRPFSALGPNDATNPRGPIPDPWYLPGKNNPWPWFYN